jgi:diguanylate cyclase (GGDEF)-like protein
MVRIFVKSATVTAIAVTAAHAISFAIRMAVERPADHVTLLMLTVLPVVITLPISLFVFLQTNRLKRANAALIDINRSLANKASRDQMTGLLNRESFMERIEVLRLMPEGGTLLIIDADHFKRINDRFGHLTGDDALIRITSAIKSALRKDDVIGRIGGEEFGAFLIGADIKEAMRVAQRIRGAVELVDFVVPGDLRVPLTVSVGGAICSGGVALSQLMRKADGCLYEAKRAGRNRVIIESALTVAA